LASPFHLVSSNHQTSHSNRPSPNPQTETPTRPRTIKAHKTPRQRETDKQKNKGQKDPAPVQPRLLQLRGCIRQVRGRRGVGNIQPPVLLAGVFSQPSTQAHVWPGGIP
jgi:hypothetical protein